MKLIPPRTLETHSIFLGSVAIALIWLLAAGSFLATLWAWHSIREATLRETALNFEQQVDATTAAIGNRMTSYEHLLLGGAALFSVSDDNVSRAEWKTYVDGLNIDKYFRGFQGIGYVEVATAAQRQGMIERVRAEGYRDFRISPPGQRPLYAAVTYIEPFNGPNLRAFGYDMFSDSTRRSAMARARDSGMPTVSGKVTLVQETGATPQPGLLMYVPVYRKGSPLADTEARRAALTGYIYAAFRMNDLIGGILSERNPMIDLEIYDGPKIDGPHLMYDSHPEAAVRAAYQQEVQQALGDHTWTLRIRSTPHFEKTNENDKATLVLVIGMLATLLMFTVAWLLANLRARALGLAEKLTVNLRNSEHRFRALVENAPVGIFLLDAAGNGVFVNDAWSKTSGVERDAAQGTGWTATLHPQDRERVLRLAGDAFRDGSDWSVDYRYLKPNGQETWVSSRAIALREENGSGAKAAGSASGPVSGHIGMIYDLTERMKVERLKAEFVSTVSHELRTPLTSIRGSLGLVMGGVAGALPPKAAQLLGIASDNCARLVRLINDILDVEKLESGAQPFDMQVHEVQPLVQAAIESNRGYADQLGVTIDFLADAAGSYARLDRDRTLQVLTNLISNAAKFSNRGDRIEVAILRKGNMIRSEVRDHGPGIAESFQKHIFEKFAQEDSSDTRAKGGTGLGLYISKKIIEQQGGTIGFHSAQGAGTCFYFELPASEPVAKRDTLDPILAAPAAPADSHASALSAPSATSATSPA